MIFGLIAAVGWGLTDFFAATAGRRVGSIATVILGQTMSWTFITTVLVIGGTSIQPLHAIVWLVLLNGIFTAAAYFTHYRALELGPVAVVSPIGAAYAVVGVVLAIVFIHEHPSVLQLFGAGVTIAGVMLVSTDIRALRAGIRGHAPGLPWALFSMVGFGVAAFLLASASRDAGWVAGMWGSRMAQLLCYLPLVVLRPGELLRFRGAGGAAIAFAMAAGVADTLGVAVFSYGTERGSVSLVLAASAIFPLIAVALSYIYLKERLVPNQYAGVVLVVAVLVLLGAST
ncbi:MAG: DMT family transporter [Actinomycetota bacterium]